MLQITILLGALVAGVACNLGDCDCIKITECEAMKQMQNKSKETANLLRKAKCGAEGSIIKVCCSHFKPTTGFVPDGGDDIENHPNLHLLSPECGTIKGSRIAGGTIALPYEFPWLTLISYREFADGIPRLKFMCGGSVINSLYVLTAAHCVRDNIAGVRVGEYDIRKKGDCVEHESILNCEPHHQDIAVVNRICHPKFKSYPRLVNDIGLLRLKKPVDFSRGNAFPICLPVFRNLREMNTTNLLVTVAGWGVTETESQSEVLLKVKISVHSPETCKAYYSWKNRNLLNNTLCAGGNGRDSCRGDSGGPLMANEIFENNYKTFQFGIVSYGSYHCGDDSAPGVYTDVRKYMKWILDNIEP